MGEFFLKSKNLKTFVQVLVSAQWQMVSFTFLSWFAKCIGGTEDKADLLGGAQPTVSQVWSGHVFLMCEIKIAGIISS